MTLRTSDGLDLAAWYVPSRNGAAVISYPTRQGKLPQARMLVRHGYGVLLLDARGYDGSEGDPNTFGWEGAKDIDAAVAWLQRRPDVSDGRIGGIGFSVGGEMMLQAAASNIGLRAVVSEGAGVRSVREHLLHGPRGWLSLPEAAVQTAAVAVLSGTAPPPSLADLVPRIAPRPLFLIYAGRGGGGEELNPDYYDAASAPKMLWKIPEAGHVGGFQARPREYEAARDALLRPSAARTGMTGPMASPSVAGIDLYWLPLGAGGHSVRLNGKVFEALAAWLGRRDRCDLYHSALEVYVPEGRFVIEQAPAWRRRLRTRRRRRGLRRGTRGRTASACSATRSGAGGTGSSRTSKRRSRALAGSATIRSRQAAPRARATGADARLGPRRARRGRDVELELDHLVAPRAQRARRRVDPASASVDELPVGAPASSSHAAGKHDTMTRASRPSG